MRSVRLALVVTVWLFLPAFGWGTQQAPVLWGTVSYRVELPAGEAVWVTLWNDWRDGVLRLVDVQPGNKPGAVEPPETSFLVFEGSPVTRADVLGVRFHSKSDGLDVLVPGQLQVIPDTKPEVGAVEFSFTKRDGRWAVSVLSYTRPSDRPDELVWLDVRARRPLLHEGLVELVVLTRRAGAYEAEITLKDESHLTLPTVHRQALPARPLRHWNCYASTVEENGNKREVVSLVLSYRPNAKGEAQNLHATWERSADSATWKFSLRETKAFDTK